MTLFGWVLFKVLEGCQNSFQTNHFRPCKNRSVLGPPIVQMQRFSSQKKCHFRPLVNTWIIVYFTLEASLLSRAYGGRKAVAEIDTWLF